MKGSWHAYFNTYEIGFLIAESTMKKTPAAYAAQVDQGEKRHPAGMVYITSTH